MLGLLLFNGEGGKVDTAGAREWLAKAARAGQGSRYWAREQQEGAGAEEGGEGEERGQEERRAAQDLLLVHRAQGAWSA